MEYRRLTNEELEEVEQGFIRFFVLLEQGMLISRDGAPFHTWENLKKDI